MKKIKRLLYDFLTAYRLKKDINYYVKMSGKNENPDYWHNSRRDTIMSCGKRYIKNGLIRNMLASYFKQSRKKYPYIINQAWIDNKKTYIDYHKMSNHIKSVNELKEKLNNGETVYITKFSEQSVYKGELFNQYGSIYSPINKKETYILCESTLPYDEYHKTNIRYSTNEEIENYNKIQKEIDSLQLIIEQKENDLWDIKRNLQNLYALR